MQIKNDIKFTPELLTEAPRRSPSVPSHDGNYAFFTVSTYSLHSQTTTVEIKILNLKTEEISLFSDDAAARSLQWLPGNQILFLKSAGSNTELWISDATGDKTPYLAGLIDSAIQNVKTKELSDGNLALSFTALQNANGTLHNPATAPKPKSTGREYESILVRNWSAYVPKETSTLFYTTLQKTDTGKYQLSEKLVNALQDTNLEFPGCPIDFIGRSGSYDLSAHGILFVTYDPEIHFATGHTLRLWYLHIPSFSEKSEKPHRIETPGFNGNFSSPVFSSSGDSAAFLATKNFLDETSYTHIFILETFASQIFEVLPSVQDSLSEPWDISPTSVFWSNNDQEIYIRGKERAREKLWRIPVINPDKKIQIKHTPTEVDPSDKGDIVEVHKLGKDANDQRLLINRSSFTDDGSVYILHVPTSTRSILRDMGDNHLKLGLNPSQVSEIVFRGAGNYNVQAWVLKPTDFDSSKSYPLAFLVHGGPKFSWSKKWSTSWNPALWAEQGYVVVLPNPSGSDSFGQAFCSAVQGDWGGRAYDDLVKCFEYIETYMPYVDTTRAIAGGYSYGGYMMNYIAGQPLAKKFKTLISQSGIFSLISLLATDLPGNIVRPFGRAPWTVTSSSSSREPMLNQWDVFDPARYTHNWTQPMLFTHGEKDFLVPVSQGLAAYNVCRMKRIESRWLSFPDEGHFVGGKENSYLWLKTVLGWANKYAGVKRGVELGECVSGRSGRAY